MEWSGKNLECVASHVNNQYCGMKSTSWEQKILPPPPVWKQEHCWKWLVGKWWREKKRPFVLTLIRILQSKLMFKQVEFSFSKISRLTARETRFGPLTSAASRWWRRNRRRKGDNRRQARRRSLPSAPCFETLNRLSLDMLRYLEIQSLPSNFLLGKMLLAATENFQNVNRIYRMWFCIRSQNAFYFSHP